MAYSRAILERRNQRLGRAAIPDSNHPAGASPTCSAWLFVRTQNFASEGKAARDTRLPYLCPPRPLPACPQFPCTAQHNWEEWAHHGWRCWCWGAAHLLQRSTRYRWLLHQASFLGIYFTTLNSLTVPPKKGFFFLENRTNSGSRRLGLEVFPCGKGGWKQNWYD